MPVTRLSGATREADGRIQPQSPHRVQDAGQEPLQTLCVGCY